jgi:hypothetical protein
VLGPTLEAERGLLLSTSDSTVRARQPLIVERSRWGRGLLLAPRTAAKGWSRCHHCMKCGRGNHPQSYRIIIDNLALLCAAYILVEPLKGARPCLLGRGLVIAFRRRVIKETMNRIRIDVTFIPDFVFLQLGFLRRISLG